MSFDDVVHSVSIAEFDIDIGNTLSHRYPDFKLEEYDYQGLANLCLPDGAHLHAEDVSYLVLEVTPVKQKKKERLFGKLLHKEKESEDNANSAAQDTAPQTVMLYGIAFFRNVKDATVRRGAIQKSMLLLSRYPYFQLYETVLRKAMPRYMEKNDESVLETVVKVLNDNVHKNTTFTLWGDALTITLPKLKEDEFQGISLINLVKLFGTDTMLLWYSLLLEQRVLFSGQPARSVGECALAAPLLVQPLHGFSRAISPYVALTDLKPVFRPKYICGTTNMLFETKSDWYDCNASVTTGRVTHTQGLTVSMGADKAFIKNVLSGIQDNRGEMWVREQFRKYTQKFLTRLQKDTVKFSKRLLAVRDSERYHTWLANKDKATEDEESAKSQKKASEIVQQLREAAAGSGEEVSALQERKLYYDLSLLLNDLDSVEEAVEAGGLEVVSRGLENESAQVRKYSASILSHIAVSIKGQIAILSGPLLDKVLTMASDDPMANVKAAACQCMAKLSTLYIGVKALVHRGVMPMLVGILSETATDDTLLKCKAVQILIQIYRFVPTTPRLEVRQFEEQLKSPDSEYRLLVYTLLDLWHRPLPPMALSDRARNHIKSLREADEAATKCVAMSFLLSEIIASRSLVIELVQGGAVELIDREAWAGALVTPPPSGTPPDSNSSAVTSKLARLALSALAVMVDSNIGRSEILRLKSISAGVSALRNCHNLLYIMKVLRFMEVASQHTETAQQLCATGAIDVLVNHILKYHDKAMINRMCRAPLETLKHVYRVLSTETSFYEEEMLAVKIQPLVALHNTLTATCPTHTHTHTHTHAHTHSHTHPSSTAATNPPPTSATSLSSGVSSDGSPALRPVLQPSGELSTHASISLGSVPGVSVPGVGAYDKLEVLLMLRHTLCLIKAPGLAIPDSSPAPLGLDNMDIGTEGEGEGEGEVGDGSDPCDISDVADSLDQQLTMASP